MPKVKICGNTNAEDAKSAVELGADYLGLIFTTSKRKIDTTKAKEIMKALPEFENFVGVFCNQSKEEVLSVAKELGLKYLQFHGDETALYCRYFMDEGFHIIKTFRMKDKMSLKRIDEYDVEAFLVDTYSKESMGGTGATFDWELIEDRPFVHEKLFLAGGLNVENISAAVQKVQPFAVDVASGVEKEPGVKDRALMEEFIRIAKAGNEQHAEK